MKRHLLWTRSAQQSAAAHVFASKSGRLNVRLSVSHTRVLCRNGLINVLSKFLTPGRNPRILVFPRV